MPNADEDAPRVIVGTRLMARAAAAAAPSMPITPGDQTVRVRVEMTYAFGHPV